MLTAKVSGRMDTPEVIAMLKIIKNFNGVIKKSDCDATKMVKITLQFEKETDASGFDICVCDLGHDVAWN